MNLDASILIRALSRTGELLQTDGPADGWRGRRQYIGTWGLLTVYAAGRRDLLATKFYANRPQDREDVQAMKPTLEDCAFVRTYLTMLRVSSRRAHLDQVESTLRLLNATKEDLSRA